MDVGQVDGMLRKVFKIIYRPGRGDTGEARNSLVSNTGQLMKLNELFQ
jgi:hypothetical protein